MLCQRCGKNQATTHIKTVHNGTLKEYVLCSDCAKQLGYDNFFPGFGFSSPFENFFGGLFGEPDINEKQNTEERCPECGRSFEEIAKTGKVGCGRCYDVFYDRLLPSIQHIHGTSDHVGKTPGKSAIVVSHPQNKIAVSPTDPIEQKKLQLKNAVEEQRYEDAAKLRDEIKEMEKNG